MNSLMFHTMYAYTEVMGYARIEELFYHGKINSRVLKRDYIPQSIKEESVSQCNRLSRSNHPERTSRLSIYRICSSLSSNMMIHLRIDKHGYDGWHADTIREGVGKYQSF